MMLSSVIESFVEDFGKRDLAAISPHISSNFQWFKPDGSLVLEGSKNFLDAIAQMWIDHPQLTNTSSISVEIGNLVTHSEMFEGFSDGHIEEWVWVYEFKGLKIEKMYGFQPTQL
jgi:hypothetical protein